MSAIVVNAAKLSEYIDGLEKNCILLQERQTAIENSFCRLGTTWNDQLYQIMNDQLAEVSASLGRIYAGMAESVRRTTPYLNELLRIEHLERNQRSVHNLPAFRSTIKKGEYRMNTYDKNASVNVDAMEDLIKELYRYINNTVLILSDLKNKHAKIGQERAWVARQYDEFGEILDDTRKKINRQLEILNQSRNDLIKSYKAILEWHNTKL